MIAALKNKRNCIAIDIDKEAIEITKRRIEQEVPEDEWKQVQQKAVVIPLSMKAAG